MLKIKKTTKKEEYFVRDIYYSDNILRTSKQIHPIANR